MPKFILSFIATFFICVASYGQAPTISSFSPSGGPVGTLVTITGTNLTNPTAFTIGGVSAIVVSNTGTRLVAMVMPGAASGTVSLTTSGGAATSSSSFSLRATPYPALQQGGKMDGTDMITDPGLGTCVAISADGNTAATGGPNDSNNVGAVWVFTRTGSMWTQQAKLVGRGAGGFQIYQGGSVALSADGNTLLEGGLDDGGASSGAFWVFTRTGNTWRQQGPKLVGTGGIGAHQGWSVSLSADGNTAAIGGRSDNSGMGAVWIFTRTDTTWSQQGAKLVGTGASSEPVFHNTKPGQGTCVALSADGNTLIEGGPNDSTNIGAAWVFTRSGSTWTQQGAKLMGNDEVGLSYQGTSVAISADGNTALIGAAQDSVSIGATIVFTRSGGTWTQQGGKLVGTGAYAGGARQGTALSLSADGNTAVVGGARDYTNGSGSLGACWVFTRSGTVWTQRGGKLVGTGNNGFAAQGMAVAVSADGSTMIEGGGTEQPGGAVWVFANDPAAGVEDIAASQTNMHFYPNPNSGTFTLETSQQQGLQYTITDMLGQMIQQGKITADKQSITIDAQSGLYLLSIEGTSEMSRFAILR